MSIPHSAKASPLTIEISDSESAEYESPQEVFLYQKPEVLQKKKASKEAKEKEEREKKAREQEEEKKAEKKKKRLPDPKCPALLSRSALHNPPNRLIQYLESRLYPRPRGYDFSDDEWVQWMTNAHVIFDYWSPSRVLPEVDAYFPLINGTVRTDTSYDINFFRYLL